MYADDTVLFSENIDDLQNMINAVNSSAEEYGLYINMFKTKVVVFRNRGSVKCQEKWFLNKNQIDICDSFVYLGILLNYNGSFLHTQKMKRKEEKLFLLYVVKL